MDDRTAIVLIMSKLQLSIVDEKIEVCNNSFKTEAGLFLEMLKAEKHVLEKYIEIIEELT